jgi:hypothetical protein
MDMDKKREQLFFFPDLPPIPSEAGVAINLQGITLFFWR